ncbi:MAG: hypothetical protein QXO94_06220 [Candidatus Bathyarchaeia archaeon]
MQEAVGENFEDLTVIDRELSQFPKPTKILSLLLNIYWHALVIYDRTENLDSFLRHVEDGIAKSGLKRIRDERAYYWLLPKPMMEVKIL